MTDRDFDKLAAAVLDGSASAADYATLEATLDTDPAAFDRFIRLAEVHATLGWELQYSEANAHRGSRMAEVQAEAAVPIVEPIRPRSEISNFQFSIFNLQSLAIAAALLAACGVAIYVYFSSLPHAEIPAPTSRPPIATLLDATGTVIVNNDIANAGREYPTGNYVIERGSAEFQLINGTTVQMIGDSAITVHNAMAASLSRGSAMFHCPPAAEGYTVHLPGGRRVVDLGTDFFVRINDTGETEIRVFDGAVVVEHEALHAGLLAGQAVAIDNAGNVRTLDEVMPVAHTTLDAIDTPEPIGPVNVYALEPDRFALAHLFDDQSTGEGADYAGNGPGPHTFVLDLARRTDVRGLRYAHRYDSGDWRVDRAARVEFTFADDPNFTDGTPAGVVIKPEAERRDVQSFVFAKRSARYVRVRLVGYDNAVNTGAALLHLLGEPEFEN